MRRQADNAILADFHRIGAARPAAQQTRRPNHPVIHHERRLRLAAQQPHAVIDAEAAAMPAGPRRTLTQRIFLIQHGVMLLEDLDRLGF